MEGHAVGVTTEEAASSHGPPVVLVDGELTDIPVECDSGRVDVLPGALSERDAATRGLICEA